MSIKNKCLSLCLFLFVFIFWYVHRNPYVAVRTEVFSIGYFKIGFSSSVKLKEKNIYTVTPAPVEAGTFAELKSYRVMKHGIFYFAEYNGEV